MHKNRAHLIRKYTDFLLQYYYFVPHEATMHHITFAHVSDDDGTRTAVVGTKTQPAQQLSLTRYLNR
ncbi:hypothetical protein JOD55_001000 [Arcanobacterium pluranimalium]|uniref:hypothetical protein n=1 Tax=Arcanobacterium pluranimalium TaxID=108028 RepID=UPI0019577F63|nr:hypothetical protein [Arcanobacterium pluranimalium]MBM7825173.1 hypothetical protein [Arcanobacterium pluranimalium]